MYWSALCILNIFIFSGCGCVATQHKCCPDNLTPAEGPGYSGCPCHTFEYGCCPDGKSVARGPGQVIHEEFLMKSWEKFLCLMISWGISHI